MCVSIYLLPKVNTAKGYTRCNFQLIQRERANFGQFPYDDTVMAGNLQILALFSLLEYIDQFNWVGLAFCID